MAIAYHRRPLMFADDSAAAALVKLGAGIAGLGYYMFHGGTNPDGLTPLEETQAGWNGYNDLEEKSYDFQAPLGEFGQLGSAARPIKTINLFLRDFGSDAGAARRRISRRASRPGWRTARPRVRLRGLPVTMGLFFSITTSATTRWSRSAIFKSRSNFRARP